MQRDPVCGREISPTLREQGQVQSFDYLGKTYFFCSLKCRTSFIDEPIAFVAEEVALRTNGEGHPR